MVSGHLYEFEKGLPNMKIVKNCKVKDYIWSIIGKLIRENNIILISDNSKFIIKNCLNNNV